MNALLLFDRLQSNYVEIANDWKICRPNLLYIQATATAAIAASLVEGRHIFFVKHVIDKEAYGCLELRKKLPCIFAGSTEWRKTRAWRACWEFPIGGNAPLAARRPWIVFSTPLRNFGFSFSLHSLRDQTRYTHAFFCNHGRCFVLNILDLIPSSF